MNDKAVVWHLQVLGLAFLSALALSAGAAEKFPNHNLMTRSVGGDADESYVAPVNDGTVYKVGAGNVTFTAPSLTGGSDVRVVEGDLTLDYGVSTDVPVLPERIRKGIRLWLDPSVNLRTDDTGLLVETWFDCRESSDVTRETAQYPYAASGIQIISADSDGNERRPNYTSSVTELGGKPAIDFGPSYSETGARWLRLQNATTVAHWVYAREVFTVFAKRADNGNEGKFLLFSGYYQNEKGSITRCPYWMTTDGYMFLDNENTRASKCDMRIDGASVWPGAYPMTDTNWHLLSMRIPLAGDECKVNQFGLDRDYARYSGGSRLAEVIMFEDRLSDADRLIVEDYLRRKWFGTVAGNIGTIAVTTNASVTVEGAKDVNMRLAGGGEVVLDVGSATARVVNDGFTGTIKLKSGVVRQDRVPFMAVSGQRLTANNTVNVGSVLASDAESGTMVKDGTDEVSISSVDPAVEKISVEGGCLRIAPSSVTDVAAPAKFPNAGFEDFQKPSGDVLLNLAPEKGDHCVTNLNWVFDRSAWASGGNLVAILFSAATNSNYGLAARDDVGLGYEGNAMGYLCHGAIRGFFTLQAAGRYRFVCRITARNSSYCLKPVKVTVDGVEVSQTAAFAPTCFMRYEVSLPYLTAGQHEIAFEECGTDAKVHLFDDAKIVPESTGAEEAEVSIANPSFELPVSIVNSSSGVTYKPAIGDVSGWTTKPTEPSDKFYTGMVIRNWFWEMTNATCVANGLCTFPGEMPDGFIAAQLYANGEFAQTVTFPSAGRYRLAFSLAKRCGLSPQAVVVKVGSAIVKKVNVRESPFVRYEAVFDIDAAGDRSLSFAGTVTHGSYPFLVGSAWLDDLSMRRIGDIPTGELVANGSFDSGTDGWTLTGAAALASSYTDRVNGKQEAPLQGADSLTMGGNASSATIPVSLAAGRHVLSFRMKSKLKYPNRTATTSLFRVKIGDEILYSAMLFDTGKERTITLPFAVAAAAEKTLAFETESNTSTHMTVLVDDVSVRPEAAASLVATDALGSNFVVEVASGAKLNLDYDGTLHVKGVRFSGFRKSGVISAERYPEFVTGRGTLSVDPQGMSIIFR